MQQFKLVFSSDYKKSNAELSLAITAQLLIKSLPVSIEFTPENTSTKFSIDGQVLKVSETAILRLLGRNSASKSINIYDETPLSRTEIDHWINITCASNFVVEEVFLRNLNERLVKSNFVVDNSLSLADICIYSALRRSSNLSNNLSNVEKWIKTVEKSLQSVLQYLRLDAMAKGKLIIYLMFILN